MFGSMDFCQACGGYDTIQTWVIYYGKCRGHVCEKCAEKYKTNKAMYQAIKNRWGVSYDASGKKKRG